jgi:hypothetical protein
VLIIAFGLSACASFQQQQHRRPPAPSGDLAIPPGDAGAQPPSNGGAVRVPSTTGVEPDGTGTQAPVDGGDGGVYVKGPDGTLWKGSKRDSAAYNADIEACYNYAAAQTANDARIEQDRSGLYNDGINDSQGAAVLSSQIRSYDHEKRRRTLFSTCMRSKGYAAR